MKRTHAKLRALIEADAENNVGALGTVLDVLDAPKGQRLDVLAIRPINQAYGQYLFREDYVVSDARDLFESVLRKLPGESADDLRKLFLLAYFEGVAGAGRELAIDEQRYIQKEISRRHGKKGSEKRTKAAKDEWEDKALLIAQGYQKQYPRRGQTWLAKEIMEKLGDTAPGEKQTKNKLSLWQKQGKLKRVRPSSKTL